MKKIVTFILLIGLVMSFAACAGKGSTEFTAQEIYDAGKTLEALLGEHENVYIKVTSNGNVIREEFLSNQYFYSFYDAEYMDLGADNASFATDHSEYFYSGNDYSRIVTLTQNGISDLKDYFAMAGMGSFISSEMLNDDASSITEKDGFVVLTCTADVNELETIGDDVVSCVETYTVDAKTREMTEIKTVYTYEDGTVEEGIVAISRDVEIPEAMKPFIAYEQETKNLRTITIVSNPGTGNEKTESIKVSKGLTVVFSPDFSTDKTFTMYSDSACTKAIEAPDANSDSTVYIKWDK